MPSPLYWKYTLPVSFNIESGKNKARTNEQENAVTHNEMNTF